MQVSLEGLTLHVTDVERALAFYARLPGAVVAQHRPGEFALLQIGKARLGLLNRRYLPPSAPGFHLEISTVDSGVDELYQQVRAGGIEPDSPPANHPWGERTFLVADPDGNQVEFDSRLEGPEQR